MEPYLGYFCRAYIGQDVQANVIARTLREAELEITRMIRGGATTAHAVQHGWPDDERGDVPYHSKTKILDERWVVIELCSAGIKEYGAFGKAVRAIWGSATT